MAFFSHSTSLCRIFRMERDMVKCGNIIIGGWMDYAKKIILCRKGRSVQRINVVEELPTESGKAERASPSGRLLGQPLEKVEKIYLREKKYSLSHSFWWPLPTLSAQHRLNDAVCVCVCVHRRFSNITSLYSF